MPETATRKYALHKLAVGDYVFPSNDARTLWRIRKGLEEVWNDDATEIVEATEVWEVWRWQGDLSAPDPEPDPFNDDQWKLVHSGTATRKKAIEVALAA